MTVKRFAIAVTNALIIALYPFKEANHDQLERGDGGPSRLEAKGKLKMKKECVICKTTFERDRPIGHLGFKYCRWKCRKVGMKNRKYNKLSPEAWAFGNAVDWRGNAQ